jgi:amino acid adenylation domain-containing protein
VRESLVNFLLSIKERIGFDEHDVWLAATRLSFDISALEIFGPLISGGKLVLAPEAGSAGLPADLIRREAATVLQATPSGWRALVGTGWEGAHGAKVLCGGEPLTADLANALLARAGEVWNVYGPTETTIWAGASRVRPGLAMPSIGGPLADTQFRVLDESLCPVPVGRTGELCIGGVLLARGYLRRPDLTAECFVPDPFGGNGARLYRTGDLVRAREDGEFDFLGRRDSQVKIRGHRVELGEVETALRSLPEVCEAAVLAPKDAVNGSHHLVAYLRLNPGTDLALADVRQRLRTLLPDPMIPSVFVKVPEFPLTPNGKLDRKMLLQTQGERLAPAHFEAPATECEVALAGIWADVLGISGPGIHDNFFELGGDSMRAVEVAARARTAGMRFEVADLFRHQTIEELAAVTVVETGAPAKMEPFALLSPEDRARIPEDVEEAYPISRLQAHMLLESERQPERGAYHNLLSLELRAALEPGRVAGALDSLISQHPVLRTAFELYCYSEPVQVIYKMAGAEFTTSDLRALDERERKQRVADRIRMEHRRRFAMNRPPLLRCHLDLLDEQRVQLTLVNHHAILDGWSRSLLVTELIARSLGPDVQAALAPHPNVFRDYVSREREGERDPSAIAFWREKLKGAPVTRLPGASAAGGSRDRITRAVPVPAEWSLRLREVAAERGVPLKTLLLAVHLRALSRLTAQPEVVTGVVVNLRPAQVGSAEALGLFLNTLPLRARTGLDWPDLVREALEGESQLLQFGHVPSARLPAASALYDTVFNFVEYRNYRKLDLHDQCEVLSATPMEETGIGFVANFGLDAFSDQVGLVLESGSGYLDASQLDRISEVYVEQLQTLCGGTLARRQKPLVHAAIEQRAGTNGDRIAIVDGDQQISYRMLDTTADRLAETLAARGVGPESIVGVSAERTVEMPCALLAVLKAGAAYLPLDPADPADRLRHMIEEAGVRIVLARAAEAGAFLPLGVEVIPTDPAASPPAVPKVPPDSSNAAYIIYTSGSSGAPKGVVVEHRSLAAYSAAAVDMFNLRPGDRVLQFASIMFDAAAEEIYPTLSAGATLVLRPRDGLVSIPAFVGMCHESSVTMLDLPTAFWHLLTEECGTQLELPAVRLVIVGGEAIRPEVLRRWRQVVRREIGLVNTYGPTEGTIVAVCCRLAGEGSAEYDGGPVAIGRPVPGVRTYLLNDDLSRVPEGAAGELYIAGTGLARGYLNRPDLTAARFLPDPYAEAQGERMYRTGDRCYRAADGALVFIGRQDRQIKFRGFRIELDEIEECLLRDPEVLAAVVLAVNAGTEQARIVALVLPRHADSRAGLARRLRESIASRLPAYCVPSEIRLVEHLPRASSGKIDRGALSALLESGPVPEGRPPSTPVEGVIASIWEELLGVEAVQRDDNFFDLGGHSLAALRLLSRLREAFGIELRLHELFESQVLSALASAVERARGRAAQRYEAPKPVAIDQVVPLSYEQSDIWVQNQATGSSRLFNMPMAAMLTGPLDAGALRASLKEIVRRHTILRTIFTSRRGVVEQVVLPPDAFDMDTLDWTGMEADERLVVEESCLPFDLEREIPFRSVLVRLSAERHLLLITMHHIASDGWSLQVLFQELSLLYSAFSSCNSAEMPKLPIQYRDYAAWQRQRMLAGDFEGDLGFWGEYLKDMKPAKSWSCEDANREPSLLYDQCSRTFGPERLAELRALARSRQCTLFMVLLAAFGVLNSRQNGEEDFRAGTLIANRNLPET